jgi:hypothetical protein
LAGLSAAVAMRLLRLRPQPRAGSLPAHRWSRQ